MSLITFDGEEKYLWKSSLLFLIPTSYGFYTGHTCLASLNLLSSIISFAFWYKPYYGFRRILDKTYQPLFCLLLNCIGINQLNKHNWNMAVIGYSFGSLSIYYYYYATKQYNKPNRFWFVYHNIFHLFTTLTTWTFYATLNSNKLIYKK